MELRKSAEKLLKERVREYSDADILDLIKGLDTYQVELELQNDELRRAQIELEDARSRYNDLYDSNPIGLVTLAPKGLVARANHTAKEMLSAYDDVLAGKGFSRWIDANDHKLYFACLQKVIDGGGRHSCVVRLVGKSGSFLKTRIDATAYFNEEKNVSEWLLMLSDVPERKQIEQMLQRRERDLRSVLNNIVAVSGVMTADGVLIEVSRTALEAANLTAEDVLGKPLEECYWWSWSPEVQKRLCGAIEMAAAGKGSRYDEVVRVGEGKFMAIDFKVTPVFSGDGSLCFLVASATDITARKRSEEELQETRAELESKAAENSELKLQLQTLLDNIPALICFYDTEDFLYLNRKAAETIGTTSSKVKFSDLMKRCYPDPRYRKEVADFMVAGLPKSKEVRMLVRDGKEIEVSWFNINLKAGTYVGIGIDNTESKASEREMRRHVKKLERDNNLLRKLLSKLTLTESRERHRLAEITQNQLQQFLFLAKLDCDILSAQIGPKHKQAAENILNFIAKAIGISRDLCAELSPPALRQGRITIALEWLADWMKANCGLNLELEIDRSIDPADDDVAVLLYQSIRELLLNVVKHAGVKSARVETFLDRENNLRVAVIDNGTGFDPGTIWQKAAAGSGLLSIREWASLLGGSFEIESSPGRGSRFTLRVPREPAKANNRGNLQANAAGYSVS